MCIRDSLQSAVFLVGYISNNSLFPEPLSSEDEQKYLELLKKGDEEARNILIEKNLRLVAHVCKKYSSTNIDLDDLISIGTIGLIKGINSFNPSKSVKDVYKRQTMNKLKIPENHSGVSKTLRLPENIADDVQNLANLKNLSFNRTIITLLEFSLSNLEEDDRLKLDKMRK